MSVAVKAFVVDPTRKQSFWCNGLFCLHVAVAESLRKHDLVIFDDRDCHAGNVLLLSFLLDPFLQVGKARCEIIIAFFLSKCRWLRDCNSKANCQGDREAATGLSAFFLIMNVDILSW